MFKQANPPVSKLTQQAFIHILTPSLNNVKGAPFYGKTGAATRRVGGVQEGKHPLDICPEVLQFAVES